MRHSEPHPQAPSAAVDNYPTANVALSTFQGRPISPAFMNTSPGQAWIARVEPPIRRKMREGTKREREAHALAATDVRCGLKGVSIEQRNKRLIEGEARLALTPTLSPEGRGS